MSTVLDPQLLAATRGLALAARGLAAGVLPGLHASRRAGLAREFSQYRAYQPGDDPRHVDWKLFARSDRYYVRESEVETALTVRLLLDATGSMRHADTTGPAAGRRKFEAARVLAAALALVAQAQGDTVGLHAVCDGKIVSAPPGQSRQPFERIVRTLEHLEPAGRWPADARPLARAFARREAREIIVVLSDLHEEAEEIHAALTPLRANGHELILFHLVGRDEIDFPFRGSVRFEDWETGEAVETDADAARAAWVEGQERRVRAWKDGGRCDYARFRLDEGLDRVLRAYLLRRMGR